jgi:hypothetical protein
MSKIYSIKTGKIISELEDQQTPIIKNLVDKPEPMTSREMLLDPHYVAQELNKRPAWQVALRKRLLATMIKNHKNKT